MIPVPAALVAFAFVPMIFEALRSQSNEAVLRGSGAVEPAGDVYAVMQIAYPACFLAMICEAWIRTPSFDRTFALGLAVFAAGKAVKYWAIATLGWRWTFRVLVPPGSPSIRSGPYRFMRHPNYAGVCAELLGTAIMSRAVVTGPIAIAGFGALLLARLRIEERALGRGNP